MVSSPVETVSPTWVLRLYVAGRSPKNARAIQTLEVLCLEHLQGKHAIEVVDLQTNPKLAAGFNVIAVPCIERLSPEPVLRVVGDLSNKEHVLTALGLTRVAKG